MVTIATRQLEGEREGIIYNSLSLFLSLSLHLSRALSSIGPEFNTHTAVYA
jgi:hypothetical protein